MRGQTHAFAVAILAAAAACKPKADPSLPNSIEPDLPLLDGGGLANKVPCTQVRCVIDRGIPEGVWPGEVTPLAIWEEVMPNSHVVLPRNRALDVLGVTLQGKIGLTADESDNAAVDVPEWHGFLARGAGVTLVAKSRNDRPPPRVLLVAVTSGEPIRSVVARPSEAWTERPAPIAVVDLTAQPDLTWGQGAYHARIGFGQDASPHASLTVLRMSAQSPVAAHLHEKEWEHMAILQGDGTFVQTIDDQPRTTHLEDGAVVSIQPGARHEWRPGGKRSFLGIQLYSPPGPEQRFKKLAAP